MLSVFRSAFITGMAAFWFVCGLTIFFGGLYYWPVVVIPSFAWWVLATAGGVFSGALIGGLIFFSEYLEVKRRGLHLIWGSYNTMVDAFEEIDAAEVAHHFQKPEIVK